MISVIEDGGTLVPENADQLREFLKNDFFIHYVGMLMPPRPGVGECVSLLEHTHYKPSTPRNELFIMRIVNWAAMVWTIVSIPIREKSFMEKIVDECGLRIAKGVPTLFSHEGFERFPADNERVFTLENKAGHPVYRNNPEITKQLFEAEKTTIDIIRGKK